MTITNGRIVRSFQEYKSLTKDEKDFYSYEQLSKIDTLKTQIEKLDNKFASKLTQQLVYGFVTLLLVSFAGAIIGIVVL